MDPLDWLPFRCWVCQGGEFDEAQQEVTVPHKKAVAQPSFAKPRRDGKVSGEVPAEPDLLASVPAEPESSDLRSSPREAERQRLRELMKAFVQRGMQGVQCHIAEEATFALRRGVYQIDERLQYLTFVVDDDAASEGSERGPFPSHAAHFAQVSEVVRLTDAEARFPQELLQELTDEQKSRLILISYNVGQVDTRQVFFLETTVEDRHTFVTCVRILKRYMDEQGARVAQQIRC